MIKNLRCMRQTLILTAFPLSEMTLCIIFHISECPQREQRQPVAGSYCQESRHWGEGCGKSRTSTTCTNEPHLFLTQHFCNSPDLRSSVWAETAGDATLRDQGSHWTLLRPERWLDRARWPGWRGVEVLRGASTGTRAVWLLSAGHVGQLHTRQ